MKSGAPLYAFLSKYVVESPADRRPYPENVFFRVSEGRLTEAEEHLGRPFPYELRVFYQEIGCGFLNKDQAGRTTSDVNRIPGPLSVADMVALGDPEGQGPREGFPDGLLPVLDLGSWLYYTMSVRGGPVYDVDQETQVADGFQDLILKLYFDRIDFWKYLPDPESGEP